jgi:hypothetical protein
MNARGWLVRLYPSAWRERYGEEFDALLAECLHSPLDVLDVLLGALDAHLGFPLETNWRRMNMVNKLRSAVLLVFAGYIGFVIGGLSLYGLVDDSPAAQLMNTTDVALRSAWITIGVASIITLLAVVAGGLPLALTVLRRVFASSRRDLRLLLVPAFSFLALVAYILFEASIAFGLIRVPGVARVVSPDNFPIGNKVLLGGRMLIFVLGAIFSVVAVWKVIAGLNENESHLQVFGRVTPIDIYRFALLPALVTTLGMLVMLAGTIAFGWLAHMAVPSWFGSNLGLLLSNTMASFAATLTIMIASTAVAVFGLARGLSAQKAA